MKDLYLSAVIGFLVGWLILLPAKNIGFGLPFWLIAVSVIGFTAFAPIALWFLKKLSRFWPILDQFGKFAAVGTLNSFIDLALFNLPILLTGVTSGFYIVVFKTASFFFSKINSYLWNKFWTFESKTKISVKEYLHFFVFTAIGALINVGVTAFVVNVVGRPAGVSPETWANVGALISIAAAFLWNFLTYKHVVFKDKVQEVF